MKHNFPILFFLIPLVVLISACDSAPSVPATTPLTEAIAPAPTETPRPTLTPTPEVTPTATPSPTLTPTPIPPSPTPNPTPTATPTPPHQLSIEYLRQQDYPGKGLTIERELEPGSNYDRYIASYLSEGSKIFALLTVPRGEIPDTGWPVIIFNHGYIPPEQYRTTERYVAYVDGFARNGYIVFRPDYRGHGSSEGESVGAYGHPGYTIDVLNATAALKDYELADPERIGMWGHSLGGYITLRSMVVDEDIKAGVIWAGVIGSYADFFDIWKAPRFTPPPTIPKSVLQWRQDLVDEYGTPAENPDFWNLLSTNAFLDDLSGPVQLHHGTADTIVPIDFSQIVDEQIQAAGGVVEYYEWPETDHNIAQSFNTAMRESVRFFNEYVKGTSR